MPPGAEDSPARWAVYGTTTNEGDGVEFTFFDRVTRRIRVHIVWFAGDLPAVKKLLGIKGHNGKRPCRFCLIAGIWSEAQRHTYYPSKMRENEFPTLLPRLMLGISHCGHFKKFLQQYLKWLNWQAEVGQIGNPPRVLQSVRSFCVYQATSRTHLSPST